MTKAKKNEIRKQEILAEIKRLRPHAEYDPTVCNEIDCLVTLLEGLGE